MFLVSCLPNLENVYTGFINIYTTQGSVSNGLHFTTSR